MDEDRLPRLLSLRPCRLCSAPCRPVLPSLRGSLPHSTGGSLCPTNPVPGAQALPTQGFGASATLWSLEKVLVGQSLQGIHHASPRFNCLSSSGLNGLQRGSCEHSRSPLGESGLGRRGSRNE